ncbi:putative ribonuclease H-like domain-containing protein, partial [Tanacetum coccineum]
DINPLFDEVLEDIECKDSYDSNLNESTFLVTPFSDSNEDEFFSPSDDIKFLLYRDPSTPKIRVVSILEGFIDEPPLEENDDLFDLESKTNDWKKILYDAPIDDLIFDPGGDIDEIDTFFNVYISMDIEDGYHDSEGDILYLESFLSNDTILSLPPMVFLDHDPRSLSDIDDLITEDKLATISNLRNSRWKSGFSIRAFIEEKHSGLLINLVTHRDLYDARMPKMIKLADMIHDNAWKWPISWINDELDVINIMVPRLRDGINDNVKWRSIDDSLVPFHTKEVMKVLYPKWKRLLYAFCLWLAMLERLQTQDKVMQWGKQTGLLCPLCNTTNDSHRHLFFMCDYSKDEFEED